MKLGGSPEYLYDYNFKAEAISDVFVPDAYIWIMPPIYSYNSFRTEYYEVIKVICSPKNYQYGKDLADRHNEIYDSPLMKALREETT